MIIICSRLDPSDLVNNVNKVQSAGFGILSLLLIAP